MIGNKNYIYVSPEDYLEGEKVSPIKHEYRQGDIYVMAGASKAHVIIMGNVFALLRSHLRGSGCIPYIADTKVRIEVANTYYYPDVVVSCDERDGTYADEDFIRYPKLIVEVLSPTTAAFDRGEKFADYRTIETLQEYVLISQERVSVECFGRNADGLWVLYPYAAGEEVRLGSVDLQCAIAAIYEDVLTLN